MGRMGMQKRLFWMTKQPEQASHSGRFTKAKGKKDKMEGMLAGCRRSFTRYLTDKSGQKFVVYFLHRQYVKKAGGRMAGGGATTEMSGTYFVMVTTPLRCSALT